MWFALGYQRITVWRVEQRDGQKKELNDFVEFQCDSQMALMPPHNQYSKGKRCMYSDRLNSNFEWSK